MINPNLQCEILNYSELICVRLQALELKIQEKQVTVKNIYGPNKDELNIFEIMNTYIQANEDKNYIMGGGDFNTVLDPGIDKKNGQTDTHKLCRQKIIDIIEINDLTDIWIDKHPDLRQFIMQQSYISAK